MVPDPRSAIRAENIALCIVADLIYDCGTMKITLAFVTLAALVCMASGAGLRRVESEVSVAMQNKVSAFMMIYGDALRHAPEYHKHPVEYLKKFINHTKGKIHSEIDGLE